jgi:hypothetical protein
MGQLVELDEWDLLTVPVQHIAFMLEVGEVSLAPDGKVHCSGCLMLEAPTRGNGFSLLSQSASLVICGLSRRNVTGAEIGVVDVPQGFEE